MSTDSIQLLKSSIDHSQDENFKVVVEQNEMRRLGLPTSFGTSRRRTKRKTKIRRTTKSNNANRIDTFSDANDDYETLDCDMTEVMAETDDNVAEEDIDDKLVDEVKTIKLSNDPYDYVDFEKLKISLDEDDSMMKRPRSETGSEVSKEDLKPPNPKKNRKKSKRQNDNTTYWKQRFVLFSRFSEGIRLDNESWYSVTPEPIARHIATRIEQALIKSRQSNMMQYANMFVIMDGFCGAGGNTIQFALMPTTALVFAIDIDPVKIEYARHNAEIYGCAEKIQFIVGDFFNVIQSGFLPFDLVDVCFLSPPWGGPDYTKYSKYSLCQMTPDGFEIARLVSTHVTRNISFLLPRNFNIKELESLSRIIYAQCSSKGEIKAEIEKNLLYTKVKTMTAYFADLVNVSNEKENCFENSIDENEK